MLYDRKITTFLLLITNHKRHGTDEIIMFLIKWEEAFYQESYRIISDDLVEGSTPLLEQSTV